MKNLKIITICIAVFIVYSCSTSKVGIKPNLNYIKDHKYTPFTIFRNKDGVGTIITFEDGFESTIASKDRCLSSIIIDTIQVKLPDFSYELKSHNKNELKSTKELIPNSDLDLSAAFEITRIKKVKIEFIDPFEIRLQRLDVKVFIENLSKTNISNGASCYNEIKNHKNLLIERVLGVKKMTYTFLDENDSAVTIDASVSNKLKLSSELANKYKGNTSLNIDFPVMVGYRPWTVTVEPGLTETEVQLYSLSEKQVKKLKSASIKNK